MTDSHVNHFRHILRTVLIVSVVIVSQSRAEAADYDPVAYMDSVEFSLVTCSPHEEVYSLYGHTALRVHDLHKGRNKDVVFNWGIFNFEAPHFVLRFVAGLTDYELGIAGYPFFCHYYRQWGSSVSEQVLNLTSEEKLQLSKALEENIKPENKVYRYNFFFDNCSTRPRDMIERCVGGEVVYGQGIDPVPSFREMIHEKTKRHPWATFGNDMLLGVKADMKTTRREQDFLPDNLRYAFSHATIKVSDGSWRPLVKQERMLVPPGVQLIEPDFLLSPLECFLILLAVSLIVFVWELKSKRLFWAWDVFLMLMTGLAGCVLFVMLFSQHPTTSTNLQFLLLNPIHLFYIPTVIRRRKTHYWTVLLVMTCLFLLGSLVQDYAEGMRILALCLLIRYCIHRKNEE